MANTLGGHNSGYGDGVTSQATGSLGTVASGSTVAVGVTYLQNTSETISSVVDSTGSNTYTLCSGTSANGNGGFVAIYRAVNVTGGAAFTVTANFTGSAGEVSVFAVEIVGADTTDPNDGGNAAYQAGTATTTDAISSGATGTPSAAGGFVFAVMSRQSGQADILAGTGFTFLDGADGGAGFWHAGSEYLIQGAAAAVAGTFTQTDYTGDTVCAVAVFKEAGSGGPATLEQEGYRIRNDDGSESSASWKAAQDTAVSMTLGAARVRVLLDATNDPASKAVGLKYAVNGGQKRSVN